METGPSVPRRTGPPSLPARPQSLRHPKLRATGYYLSFQPPANGCVLVSSMVSPSACHAALSVDGEWDGPPRWPFPINSLKDARDGCHGGNTLGAFATLVHRVSFGRWVRYRRQRGRGSPGTLFHAPFPLPPGPQKAIRASRNILEVIRSLAPMQVPLGLETIRTDYNKAPVSSPLGQQMFPSCGLKKPRCVCRESGSGASQEQG